MTVLIQTASRWGNLYRLAHYIDGRKVAKTHWDREYERHRLTPEQGAMQNTSYGFRKRWEIH